jgi:4-hydroxythreonine-4-phosphate dehydrogenase
MTLPRIGITLGDPGGIGPEVVLKALSSLSSLPRAKYILFGSTQVIEEEKCKSGIKINIPSSDRIFEDSSNLSLIEVEISPKVIEKGNPSHENGEASYLFFREAVKEAKNGSLQAIVTAPISKESWNLAGFKWAGHTDFLSYSYPQAIMTFWSDSIKVALFSHHIPLKEALEKIKKEELVDFFTRLHGNLDKIYPKRFDFLVAGLNPHAGEDGLIGSEERKEVIPAIEEVRSKGVRISGPFPPDVVFRNAINQSDKIVIGLYHDQALIPFKIAAFDKGVNVTLGLPFVRTSPDHGTAFDIAGKGIANPQSMIEAIKLAYEFSVSSLDSFL